MAETPVTQAEPAIGTPERRRVTSGERVAAAALAMAGGVGILAAVVGLLAEDAPSLLLAPLFALAGGVALWRFTRLEQRRAEAANRAKSGVLAAVSHEFRTPLNGILSLTGLLLESDLTADQRTYARGVRTSGEALLRLVDDMLDFSRIEAGRLELRSEPTDLARMAEEIGELLASRAHSKGIDLAIVADRDLPVSVGVDAQRLRQVLINLLANAIKFTEAGGVTLSVRPGEAGKTYFAVADTGVGIDPAEAERIFGEFEQIDTAPNRRNGGTGLGLAISRRIVRHMGGDIAVAARPGGGSVFSFELGLPPAEAAGGATPELRDKSVMILGPAGPEADAIARQLAAEGAHVRHVPDLVEAAALAGAASAAALPYDAVLVDARLPQAPAQILARLRTVVDAPIAAAIIIEPGGRGSMPALREAGYDAYLVRPVRRRSLVGVVAGITGPAGAFHADPEDIRAESVEAGNGAAARLDILLAEDNEINALLVRAVLEGLGHRVTEVRDGAAAVEAATQSATHHGVILMDLHMPGLDGLEATRAIREHEQRTGRQRATILALTADVLAETRAASAAAGIDAVLEKPIAPERLRQKLAEITGQPVGSSAV